MNDSIPRTTIHLVQLRIGQVIGSTYHTVRRAELLRKAGGSEEQLDTVASWPTSPYFSDAERIALELAEAIFTANWARTTASDPRVRTPAYPQVPYGDGRPRPARPRRWEAPEGGTMTQRRPGNHPVETTALTKRYGTAAAVEDLDLSVPAGEVYGFLGPNGAGKTTTLRMLLGLVRPTSGRVRLFGAEPGGESLARVGALIEGPAFYPYLSGRANLRILADHAGVRRTRVDGVLDVVSLTDRAKDRYSTYSLGMKQRLGLAAALLKDPELVVLDEPTNGLDPAGMADMRVTLRKLAAGGCTVLLSSHLLAEVEQICDRVGVLDHGRLVAEATVEELRAGGALRVVADPVDRARVHLGRLFGADRVRVAGNALEVDVGPGRAARVNAELVAAGCEVSELCWREPDLEQTFLALTGGAGHAA
ncbi:ATP-binding cassette domain-containing protein [Amycolatopsis sp. cmx-4-68]|uniref:ATP-binding cassette domain-containing protein n=1 Tax=Amycolatopsis sp. cmx-4-68 TaxID=2790938 RepID=UPI003977F957